MKAMTGLLAFGAAAAATYAARRAKHHAHAKHQQEMNELDLADLDEPVVVTEQEVIVTDAELVPPEDYHPAQEQQQAAAWEMPGRGAGPR
jgi:hypothetical protein